MLIPLVHGEPIRFGADNEKGVVMGTDGQLRIVEVADVGEDALLVHDEHQPTRASRFALSRLRHSPTSRRRSACSATSTGPSTRRDRSRQLASASERRAPATCDALLHSGGTWDRRLTVAADVAERPCRSAAWVEERRLRAA